MRRGRRDDVRRPDYAIHLGAGHHVPPLWRTCPMASRSRLAGRWTLVRPGARAAPVLAGGESSSPDCSMMSAVAACPKCGSGWIYDPPGGPWECERKHVFEADELALLMAESSPVVQGP